jgi:hypothetical protein
MPQHPTQAISGGLTHEQGIKLPKLGAYARISVVCNELCEHMVITSGKQSQPLQQLVTPKATVHLMNGDPLNPRSETLTLLELTEVTQRLAKGVLDDVLGIRRSTEQTLCSGEHLFEMPPNQMLASCSFT